MRSPPHIRRTFIDLRIRTINRNKTQPRTCLIKAWPDFRSCCDKHQDFLPCSMRGAFTAGATWTNRASLHVQANHYWLETAACKPHKAALQPSHGPSVGLQIFLSRCWWQILPQRKAHQACVRQLQQGPNRLAWRHLKRLQHVPTGARATRSNILTT